MGGGSSAAKSRSQYSAAQHGGAAQAVASGAAPAQQQGSVQLTCKNGHSLCQSKILWDRNSADPTLRRPILCDDCVDFHPDSQWEQAIIYDTYAMQCKEGCDFALCQRCYQQRAKAAEQWQAQAAGQGQAAQPGQQAGRQAHRGYGSHGGSWASQDSPQIKRISFQDPRQAKGSVGVVSFYFPGHAMAWDSLSRAGFLGNFWDVRPERLKVEGTANGERSSHHFSNAEAAFQALKFWGSAHLFEYLSGDAAFNEKRRLVGLEDRSYAGYGSNWSGMKAVLDAKFKLKAMSKLLLKTDDAYLLEHNSQRGRDDVWSDNCDGSGMNWLGLQLMLIRDEHRKQKTWTPFLRSCIDMETGVFVSPAAEAQWRDSVRAARRALAAELEKLYPGQQLPAGGFRCSKAACGKPTWNGQPNEYCSKACKTSIFMASAVFMGGGLSSLRTPLCLKPGCGKPTWNGASNEYCSRKCRGEDQASILAAAGGGAATGYVQQYLCLKPGCGKPTWNGAPNEYCSKACRPAVRTGLLF